MQLFGTKGQKFLPCPGTTGQALKPCHGTGQDFDSLSRPETSRGTEMKEKALKKWDFFSNFSSSSCFGTYFFCFRTSFPVLERPFPVLERPFPVSERHFPVLNALFLS